MVSKGAFGDDAHPVSLDPFQTITEVAWPGKVFGIMIEVSHINAASPHNIGAAVKVQVQEWVGATYVVFPINEPVVERRTEPEDLAESKVFPILSPTDLQQANMISWFTGEGNSVPNLNTRKFLFNVKKFQDLNKNPLNFLVIMDPFLGSPAKHKVKFTAWRGQGKFTVTTGNEVKYEQITGQPKPKQIISEERTAIKTLITTVDIVYKIKQMKDRVVDGVTTKALTWNGVELQTPPPGP